MSDFSDESGAGTGGSRTLHLPSSGAQTTVDAVNRAADRLSTAGCEAMKAMSDLVKAKPLETAAMALGLGYILGAMCRRGHR